jgi:predicted ribosome quality control (RQC) complex YloA/Tae2 family protein
LNYYNYFSEIEETFNRRRGKYLFLSPLDWALIESWQEKGVPLHIVVRGIEKVFDGFDAKPNRRRTVKSLTYCQEEIEAQYDEWLERQIGKNSAEENSQPNAETNLFAGDAVREHLRRVAQELNEAAQAANRGLRETLEKISARIAELEKNYADAETLENSLSDLEKMIDERLIETADETELAQIKAQAEKNLAQYRGKMDGEVFERTFDLMVLKSLRENAGIPRLSLFYL